jgi:two-component system, chemotaxis family, chemotaxis protein CheY
MKTILLVEDDVALSWLLQKILERKYKVTRVSDGLEAWAWLSESNSCDLVISDVNLPLISGTELLENLRTSSLYAQIPVLMLSALEDQKEICMKLGAIAFVSKPFNPQDFLQEVMLAVDEAPEYSF